MSKIRANNLEAIRVAQTRNTDDGYLCISTGNVETWLNFKYIGKLELRKFSDEVVGKKEESRKTSRK